MSLVIGNNRTNIMVKANTDDMQKLISQVEAKWNTFSPNQRFRYNFLDDQYAKMYDFEQRVGNIFSVLTGLAIFIACLGLFALATFMAEQRSKEIGIRMALNKDLQVGLLLNGLRQFCQSLLTFLIDISTSGWEKR